MIYLFQSGAPSQLDTFDPKPQLRERFGSELPDSIRQGQRLTTIKFHALDLQSGSILSVL